MAIKKIKIGSTEHELQTTIANVDGLQAALDSKGTSNLKIGTAATDAAAGNHTHSNYITTDKYHTTGSWSGLTYTATAQGGAGALAFTIPTGTTSTTVALGNHTHSNYVPTSRTINGKALSSNISITASDVGITYGTTDLSAGSSSLAEGTFYFVYE